MENSETRPRPGAPPRLDQPKAMLEYLLDIEVERLQTAIRIERERKIVFPETTVIIRDILKLHGAIYGNDNGKVEIDKRTDTGDIDRYQ